MKIVNPTPSLLSPRITHGIISLAEDSSPGESRSGTRKGTRLGTRNMIPKRREWMYSTSKHSYLWSPCIDIRRIHLGKHLLVPISLKVDITVDIVKISKTPSYQSTIQDRTLSWRSLGRRQENTWNIEKRVNVGYCISPHNISLAGCHRTVQQKKPLVGAYLFIVSDTFINESSECYCVWTNLHLEVVAY